MAAMRRFLVAAAALLLLASVLAMPLEDRSGATATNSSSHGAALPFGHAQLANFFMKKDYWNLNHGAFGSVCKPAAAAEQQYYTEMESDANIWYRGVYQAYLDTARERLSAYVGAKRDDLVLVENASAAVNAVLRSLVDTLPMRAGDTILIMNVAYPMVKSVIAYLVQYRGLTVTEVTIPFPLVNGDDDFLAPMRQALIAGKGRIKVVSLDHIASYPSVILPIKQLTALCHEYGALVLVDGAHCLGQININITDINADFYLANAHKWLYAPKGAAFLWVRPSLQPLILPTVISSEYRPADPMWERFQYVGTRNYNALLAVTQSLDFRASLGESNVMNYIHQLAWQAAGAIRDIFKTRLLVPEERMNGALISIALPTNNATLAYAVQAALLQQYDTYVQLGTVANSSPPLMFVRISAQIYLELSDFTTMAHRWLQLQAKLQ